MSDPQVPVAFTVVNGYIQVPVDVDPDVLLQDQLDIIAKAFPGWRPYEGHLEVALLEAIAQMVAETAQVAAQMPVAAFAYFGSLVGITPEPGTAAQVTTSWTLTDTLGRDPIPAGTVIGFQDGTDVLTFETIADTPVPEGTGVLTGVVCIAQQVGAALDGIPAGPMIMVDALNFVESVASTDTTSGGADPETQAAYLSRLSNELQFIAPRPILPRDFAALAQQTPGVARALAVDLYSPGRTVTDGATVTTTNVLTSPSGAFNSDDVGRTVAGTGIPSGTTINGFTNPTAVQMSHNATASNTGLTLTLGDRTDVERCIAVAAVDAAGADVSDSVGNAMLANLEAKREVNFLVTRLAVTYTEIDVATTVMPADGVDTTALQSAVQDAITAFLDPAAWGGGTDSPPQWLLTPTVRYLDVANVIHNVPGVLYIEELTICVHGGTPGSSDVTLAGVAPLPQAATIAAVVDTG